MSGQVLLFGRGQPQPGPAGFDEFWRAYPRRVARLAAQKAWHAMSIADRAAAVAAVPAHVAYWQARDTADDKIPHPASWLNGRRWEDELPGTPQAERARDDRARRIAEGLRR